MPRPPKRGIDYAGWSVNIFDGDRKIDKLLDAQGWKGFGVYFFLCQLAYKMNGYYLEWDYDDCASTARKMGGGVGSETVREAVDLCLRIGLFDIGLFDRWKVLTSRGIQRRFWAATGERGTVYLNKNYWLLAADETKGIENRAVFVVSPPQNEVSPPQNEVMTPRNAPKLNEIKVNKIKSNSEECARTREEVQSLVNFYEQGAGIIATPYFTGFLEHFVGLLGFEIAKHGIEAAFGEGKTSPKYILAILRRYEREGLDTLDKVEQSERRFELEKKHGKGGSMAVKRVKRPEEYSKGGFLDYDD